MANPVIDIRYAAVPNRREGYGWIPMVSEDGNVRTNTWSSTAYDRETALAMARQIAQDTADRYVGDWDIRIAELRPAAPPKPPAPQRRKTTRAIATWAANWATTNPLDPERIFDELARYLGGAPSQDQVNVAMRSAVVAARNVQRQTHAGLRASHSEELARLRKEHRQALAELRTRQRDELRATTRKAARRATR